MEHRSSINSFNTGGIEIKRLNFIILGLLFLLILFFSEPHLIPLSLLIFSLGAGLYIGFIKLKDQFLLYLTMVALLSAGIISLSITNPFSFLTILKIMLISFLSLFLFAGETMNIFEAQDSSALKEISKNAAFSTVLAGSGIIMTGALLINLINIYTLGILIIFLIVLLYYFLEESRKK